MIQNNFKWFKNLLNDPKKFCMVQINFIQLQSGSNYFLVIEKDSKWIQIFQTDILQFCLLLKMIKGNDNFLKGNTFFLDAITFIFHDDKCFQSLCRKKLLRISSGQLLLLCSCDLLLLSFDKNNAIQLNRNKIHKTQNI